MADRMVRDLLLENEKLLAVSHEAMLMLLLLANACDDFGNTYGTGEALRSHYYPLLQRFDARGIDECIGELEKEGLIFLYGAEGRVYLHFLGWEDLQTLRGRRRSNIPDCYGRTPSAGAREHAAAREGDNARIYNYNHIPITKYSKELREVREEKEIREERNEREKREKREKRETPPSFSDTHTPLPSFASPDGREEDGVCVSEKTKEQFERFWSAYPKKVGRREALDAFCRIAPDEALLSRMIDTLRSFSESKQWRLEDGRYVPHPKRWLEGEHWTDEVGKTEETESFQRCDAEMAEYWEIAMNKPFRTHRED